MPTRHGSSSEPSPLRKEAVPVRRHVVLFLGEREDALGIPPSTARSRHRCDRLIVAERTGRGEDAPGSSGDADWLRSWRRIGAEHCAACLGIVAEPGAATRAVARILDEEAASGLWPGAVALLGYDPGFAETCLTRRRGAGSTSRTAPRPWSDAPPVMMLLPANDPSLADCAAMCRRLRSLGSDVRLEVTAPFPVTGRVFGMGALGAEAMAEMDAFFEANLGPCFPKMPREAW